MEGEQRDLKLKAGKEKLAQYQNKKRKKKQTTNEPDTGTRSDDTTACIVPTILHVDETDSTFSVGAVSLGEEGRSGTRDQHVITEQNLDTNHNCNEGDMESASETTESYEIDAHSNNEAAGSQPSQPLNTSDVQELLHTAQWLQLQLKQANSVVQEQNKKHVETAGALEHAKKEISALQDSITTKDQLLNNVVEKMTHLSKEYSTLKQNYTKLTQVRNEDLTNVLDRELKLREELSEAVKIEMEEKNDVLKKLEESHKGKIAQLKEERDVKMKKLEEELAEIKEENCRLVYLTEDYENDKESVETRCDTLTKGLEFLKVEHEKSVGELDALSNEFKHLKSNYDILLEEKEKLEVEVMHSESNNSNYVGQINVLQATLNSIETQLAETLECDNKLKSEQEQLLKDNAVLVDELTKVKEDNCMYQKQIHVYEEKLLENEEVLEENHSLRIQNDELNNKINNQKDMIASLKNELNILSVENKQLTDQLDSVSVIETENTNLKEERNKLLNELSSLNCRIVGLEGENAELKDSQHILNEEILSLKESLCKSEDTVSVEVPLLTCVQKDLTFAALDIDSDYHNSKNEVVHETIVAEVDAQSETPLAQLDAQLQVHLLDHSGDNSDKVSVEAHTNDTAYESFHCDSLCQMYVDESNEHLNVDNSDGHLIKLQQEYDCVLQALHCKTKECEELQKQLEETQLKSTNITSTAPAPVVLKDVQMDNVDNHSNNEVSKVSENGSVASLEQEVNMHASSSLCFVENDGVVSLDNSQGIVSVGESDVHVLPSDAFQPTTDEDVAAGPDQGTEKNQIAESCDELAEKLGATEQNIVLHLKEINDLKKVNNESCEKINELNKCVESHVIREGLLRKDYENTCAKNAELQAHLKQQCDKICENEEKMKNLTYVNEKLTWECDETRTVNDGLEKRILEINADKSDVEFEKLRFEEELIRVKERLDYLESSDSDIMEIKDMLEKVQEERENIYIENEKLQGSLSLQVEENEKLLETLECLHKENSSSLQKLKEVTIEMTDTNSEIENLKHVNNKLIINLEEEKLRSESLNEKFGGEIEGLLEENSTLKTSVDMKNAEIDNLQIDNERLNSFFPNIGEHYDKSALLVKCNELEAKVEELSTENEQIMNELVQTQDKVLGISEENEGLLDKCEEFQKVITDLDNEKTALLNTIDQTNQDVSVKLKEGHAMIEKYEIQLEGLDQENSTLKTQILSLRQDIEEGTCVALAGAESRTHFMQSSDLSDLVQENEQLKLKCASIESDLHDIQERESYLTEQSKMYENQLGSATNSNDQETKRILAQLELEKKYKHKFEKDLESTQYEIIKLQKENVDLKFILDQQQRDATVLSSEVNVMKQRDRELMSKFKVVENEKLKLLAECKELRKRINDSNKENKDLNCQLNMLQHHVHAMSENCMHVRSQVEILAAEVDTLTNAKDVLQSQYNDLVVVCEESKCENKLLLGQVENNETDRLELEKECEKLMREYENLTAKLDEEDIHGNHEELTMLKDDLAKAICALEEEKNENDKLKEDLESFGLRSDELNDLRLKNSDLQHENTELQQKNETLSNNMESLKEKLNQVDELIEINRISNVESDDLVKRMDSLHEIIKELQTQKEALQKVTDDLSNMLHDMQGKYEEVKSEMETAKKECGNEIVQLENKLRDMNNDVCELRKMLDFMENEMYSASEEKIILKENLEQQQTQFAEVVEQKQKLEDILNQKQQKDLKNMQVASQRQKNASLNSSRSELDFALLEGTSLPPDCEELSTNQVQDTLVMESVSTCDIPSQVPSFENVFHMFGLDTAQEDNQHSRLVQTNVSFIGTENVSIMVDDNGEHGENTKDLNLIDCGTQTVSYKPAVQNCLVSEILKGIDIHGDVLTFQQSEDPLSEPESLTESDDMSSLAMEYNITSVDHVLYQLHQQKVVDSPINPTLNKADEQRKDQSELGMNDQDSFSENTETSDDLKTAEFGCEESDFSETVPEELCILSPDSSSSSASLTVKNTTLSEGMDDFSAVCKQDSEELGQSVEQDDRVLDEFADIGSQTELNFQEEVSKEVEIESKKLKSEFDENLKKVEAEVEIGLLKQFDFREEKVKLLEDNYEKKVRQIEYDMEEKFVQKFRNREAEIIVEAERDKKAHATEVENSARRKIEQIAAEKNQQFVEALRQVKADFSKKERHVSGDIRRVQSEDSRHAGAQTGPGGDALQSNGGVKGGQLEKLQLENQKLTSARDVLLHQIDISQQEQEVLVEHLQVIMGEQNAMNETKQTHGNQLTPAWLDWELNPEMSFDSVRSSLDTKCLSASLDTTCDCSNSDCLNVRMKYDQLIDRIQKFLKMRATLEEPVQSSEVDKQAHSQYNEGDNNNFDAPTDDRYIAHDEPDSQSLQRITSIHLEHSVRVLAPAGSGKDSDQFVQEEEFDSLDGNDTAKMSNDIIDMLVKNSTEFVSSRNEDGRFSESDSDSDEQETITKPTNEGIDSNSGITKTFAPLQRSKFHRSFVAHHLDSDEEDKVHMKKRHFSDSDAHHVNEGSFVAERNDGFVKTNDDNFLSDDDVFESNRTPASEVRKSMSHLSDGLQLTLNQSSTFNTEDSSREGITPGSEEIFISKKPLTRTGEETGDFFDEKVEFTVSFPSMSRLHHSDPHKKFLEHKTSDKICSNEELSEGTTDYDHFDSGDILETLGSKKSLSQSNIYTDSTCSESQFVLEENQPSNAIQGDVLSGTQTFKRDSIARSVSPRRDTPDSPQSLPTDIEQNPSSRQRSYENAVFDILNSICPGTDPGRRLAVEVPDNFDPVPSELEAVTDDLSETPDENDLEKLRVESKDLKSTIQSLINENEELKNVIKLKNAENEKDLKVLVEEVHDLNQKNGDLEKQLSYLDYLKKEKQSYLDIKSEKNELLEQLTVLNSKLEIKNEEVKELESVKDELSMVRQKNKTLDEQIVAMMVDNDACKEKIKNMHGLLRETEKQTEQLRVEKAELVGANIDLQSLGQSQSTLLKCQDELKSQIEKAVKEKEDVELVLEDLKTNLIREKTDLENSLLSLANSYEALEQEKIAVDEMFKATQQNLDQEISKAAEQKLEAEIRVHEITQLKDEKNQLNNVIAGLTKAIEKLKDDVVNKTECIENLKSEKETMNETLKRLECINQDFQGTVIEKTCSLEELSQSEKSLNQMVHELQSKVESLESESIDLTTKLNDIMKDNDVLKCDQDEAKHLKSENEILKSEICELKDRNNENEWAIRQLSSEIESKGNEQSIVEQKNLIDQSTDVADMLPEPCTTDDIGKNEVHNSYSCDRDTSAHMKIEIDKLTEENQSLRVKLEKLNELEILKNEELETLKLENETMKRSLDHVMARSDSDTDLQIFEDMKDAIKSMETEKASAEIHQQALTVNTSAENKRLQEEVEELYVENDNLRKKLMVQEESARKENSEILKMYSDLRDEVEVLVISKHDLEVELHALKDLLEQDPYPMHEKSSFDSSKELTLQDLEEMDCLKTSIEKLKSDLKEKDGYVRKLEEHLLNVGNKLPDLTSTPKPLMSRGTPKTSKSFLRRPAFPRLDRRAYSQDLPNIIIHPDRNDSSGKPDLERSQTLDGSLHVADLNSSLLSERQFSNRLTKQKNFTSSLGSDSFELASIHESLDTSEKIKSGLSAKEDGHLALELKQFELVAEITKLRRDFRETKSVYAKETALLTEALEKEKMTNQLRGIPDFSHDHSVGSNLSHDVLKLRKEVSRLREENKMLTIDCDRWMDRLQEQEQIVADLREKVGRNTSEYGEIEEVFGRQLALLQKQRGELIDQLQYRNRENVSLSETIGEKVIIEETLRKEKELLFSKMKNMEGIEQELDEKKKELEKAAYKLKEVEDIVYQKDLNEIELMKQKRILEEELKEIESRFRDKEENLDFEKNRLLAELREKRMRRSRSRFSESDDEVSSVCSESAAFSDRNIGRLEIMLEEVEKQHSVAVNVLRDQLHVKYSRQENELRKDHAVGMFKLKQASRKQVNPPQNV